MDKNMTTILVSGTVCDDNLYPALHIWNRLCDLGLFSGLQKSLSRAITS